MKILLASLMCLILGTAPCFAIKGGPVYPVGGNITGNYAGILQGAFDPTNPASGNSIGIFTLAVPKTGNSTGVFLMFSRGRVFTGTADAFADPNKASLKGILSASFNYTLHVPVTTTDANGNTSTTFTDVSVTASAAGPINATVSTAKSASAFSSSATILTGDATLNISEGGVAANGDPLLTSVLSLLVTGIKQ